MTVRTEGSDQAWELCWTDDESVQLALYLRDVLALSVDTDPFLPAVDPGVPVEVPPHIDRAEVQRQWPMWWEAVLSFSANRRKGGPAMPEALAEDSAISVAVQHFRDSFARRPRGDSPSRRPSHTSNVGAMVRELEEERGRKVRPFQATVTVVSVDGEVWHRLSRTHVLASRRFAADQAACERALRELVTDLF
ncbi:hypothetical protein CFN78_09930 [Amycolatopsis antarctica]|uniref:Uncharacterized protein n=1 Tax=Amycolatopsis antarctica TaxID=1854586 RepID=A0A263D6T5_9PSEU|nr:hypothetical protein [Amycolatopsis antarctica]OZM73186.1 hypothetical protein CFN78_09930 [Amycolatopsis antarctica]